jgi:putative membrane protein
VRLFLTVISLAALTACGGPSSGHTAAKGAQTLALADTVSTEDFIQLVANINEFQIEAAGIAGERATREDVKAFAGAVAVAHEAKQNELVAAAERVGLKAIPTLGPDQQERLAALRTASPEAFDALYLDQQIEAHEAWVDLFNDYLTQAPATPVRTWAENTNALFRTRLDRAHALEQAG